MIAVYADCNVKEEHVAEFISVAKELIEKTREEVGNISYELIRSTSDEGVFAFLEKWKSEEALELHMVTGHFTGIVPRLSQLMNSELKINVHEVLI
ncbi:MAG: putative quinol monooxygenase [Lachnospiraceae bacterium]|nr:putative quinol monooxygenase [Lachnospiraceae bacterium]